MPEGALTAENNLTNIFRAALIPAAWESGNIPPLSRLIGAFISRKDARSMILENIEKILGIFTKLINSKANDHNGFFILNCLVHYLDVSNLSKYLPQCVRIIFRRIQSKKTNKVLRGLLLFLSTVILNCGVDYAINLLNSIQPNMFSMMIEKLVDGVFGSWLVLC